MGKKNMWRSQYENHPTLQHVKRMLCRKIVTAIAHDKRSTVEAATYLGTSRATISRIYMEKTDQLSFNQLFFFLVRLRPFFEILITANRNG